MFVPFGWGHDFAWAQFPRGEYPHHQSLGEEPARPRNPYVWRVRGRSSVDPLYLSRGVSG